MSVIKCCGARWDSKLNICPRCGVSFIETLETNLADAREALEEINKIVDNNVSPHGYDRIFYLTRETLNRIKGGL